MLQKKIFFGSIFFDRKFSSTRIFFQQIVTHTNLENFHYGFFPNFFSCNRNGWWYSQVPNRPTGREKAIDDFRFLVNSRFCFIKHIIFSTSPLMRASITIFPIFPRYRSRIFTRIEWWYSQVPNQPRERDQ